MGEETYGFHVWKCAEVLASYILAHKAIFAGKIVLELGCGTGLCGIVAGKCGAVKVILSDKPPDDGGVDHVKTLATENFRLNGFDAENSTENCLAYKSIVWGVVDHNLTSLPKIDLIIGSDCFYDPEVFDDLLLTVAFILGNNPLASFIFSYQIRSADWSIEYLLAKYGLTCELLHGSADLSHSIVIGKIEKI